MTFPYLIKLKISLEGSHFESLDIIQNNMAIVLKGLSATDFQQYFQAW
jgi:hypothetical protein